MPSTGSFVLPGPCRCVRERTRSVKRFGVDLITGVPTDILPGIPRPTTRSRNAVPAPPPVPVGRARARHRAPTSAERARAGAVRALRSCVRPGLAAIAAVGVIGAGTAMASLDRTAGAHPGPAAADETPPATMDPPELGLRAVEAARSRAEGGFGVSRGAVRPGLTENAAVSPDRSGAEPGVAGAARVRAPSDPRDIARAMLASRGWSGSQFACLDDLWIGESNWDPYAENPSSGAYGIPQALPAEKMATAGSDWATNPVTQITWGLTYIAARYGSPCEANSFKLSNGWY